MTSSLRLTDAESERISQCLDWHGDEPEEYVTADPNELFNAIEEIVGERVAIGRRATARAWNAFLEQALADTLDDGTPILAYVFALNSGLSRNLADALEAAVKERRDLANCTQVLPPESTAAGWCPEHSWAHKDERSKP